MFLHSFFSKLALQYFVKQKVTFSCSSLWADVNFWLSVMQCLCFVVFCSVVDVCLWNYVVMVSVVFKIITNFLLLQVLFFSVILWEEAERGGMCVKTTAVVKFAQHTGLKTPHDAVAPWTESTMKQSIAARAKWIVHYLLLYKVQTISVSLFSFIF